MAKYRIQTLIGFKYVLLTAACICFHSANFNAQPAAGGISMEDALREANELLRQHGIDPTGGGLGHGDHDEAAAPSAKPLAEAPAGVTVAPAEAFRPLSIDEIIANQDVWPAQVVITDRVEFTSGLRLTPGNLVDFSGFEDRNTVALDYQNQGLTLPHGLTDIEQRANDVASGRAKADGFRGRMLEQLDGRIVELSGGQMRNTSTESLADADLFLLYMSSDACGWCRQFTPELTQTVERVKRQYPGKLRVIHASVDRNLSEFASKYQKIDADAAIPPGDRWFINAFSNLHPGVRQIPQPSLMLLNASGRLIDSGSRQNRNTKPIDAVLARLESHVARSETLVPAWTRIATPLADVGAQTVTVNADPIELNAVSDPTLSGPEPYPATNADGTPVPGLVLYDKTATGSRIPALTIQKFKTDDSRQHYYVLSFRQVLGQTFGSKPLLTGWLKTTTRSGPSAEDDLAARVDDFKALHEKYLRWKDTAISNQVSEFRKPIFTIPQTRVDNRVVLQSFSAPGSDNTKDPGLEVLFTVSGKAENATLKAQNITWMRSDMNAFDRLIPHIDLLVGQLELEESRLYQQTRTKEQNLQDIDSLFQ